MSLRRLSLSACLLAACALATGCSHHTNVARNQANAPVLTDSGNRPDDGSDDIVESRPRPPVERGKPGHYVEVGWASWYGPKYNHRAAADGSRYDEDGLTAAHRTLPLGSIVKVTNLKNGIAIKLKITDRGPFVPDRMLDLSIGSAKALGIWPHGTSQVRVELLSSPTPKVPGGKWCVQVGAFKDESNARALKAKLQRKYSDAEVLEFGSPTGDHWVRIRPSAGDRKQAYDICETLRPVEGNAYLVRLD